MNYQLPTSALQTLLRSAEKAQARLEKQSDIKSKKRIQASQKARESLKKTRESLKKTIERG